MYNYDMHVLVLPVFNSIIYDTVCDVPACGYVALWENLGSHDRCSIS